MWLQDLTTAEVNDAGQVLVNRGFRNKFMRPSRWLVVPELCSSVANARFDSLGDDLGLTDPIRNVRCIPQSHVPHALARSKITARGIPMPKFLTRRPLAAVDAR
jgi:hypothetical protein